MDGGCGGGGARSGKKVPVVDIRADRFLNSLGELTLMIIFWDTFYINGSSQRRVSPYTSTYINIHHSPVLPLDDQLSELRPSTGPINTEALRQPTPSLPRGRMTWCSSYHACSVQIWDILLNG